MSGSGPRRLAPRAALILREIVEQYVETGDPVGSRTLATRLPVSLSPASIRAVMAELTDAGLLSAPHVSAGRLPTERGLRLFVDGLLQSGTLSDEDQDAIGARLSARGRSLQEVLTDASAMLSGLSAAAGVVLAPKSDGLIRHIEFVSLAPTRALVILVGTDGQVENRLVDLPPGLPPSALIEAGNYLNARAAGRTLAELRRLVGEELAENRSALDALAAGVVQSGLATWSDGERGGALIVRGQARLLGDLAQTDRIGSIQALFERLETQETMLQLLELAEASDGVRIFIGAESGVGSPASGGGEAAETSSGAPARTAGGVPGGLPGGLPGVATVVSAARNDTGRIVGAIGVIGPTRLNYGRVIPVVDYTARIIGRLLG